MLFIKSTTTTSSLFIGILALLLAACTYQGEAPKTPPEIAPELQKRSNYASEVEALSLAPHMQIPEDILQSQLEKMKLSPQNTTEPLLLTHYSPWFQTPSVTGYWGKHWTMNNCDPDTIDPDGRREICSHYYPLVGPYDSLDPDLLEYHILLMKLSGIDGIIIDFYGLQPYYDWPELKEATDFVINKFNDAGMKFSVMYLDQTVDIAFNLGFITDPVSVAQADLDYIENSYFSLENYVHVNNEPLLMNYGPRFFTTAAEWQTLYTSLEQSPPLASLGYVDNFSATTFPWIEWPDWANYLTNYYAWINWKEFDVAIGSAYHSFHDYYFEGGWGSNLYVLDDQEGQRFTNYLHYNAQYNPDIIQLNTWNGFADGTMLEPTVEFGYKYLTELQAFTGSSFDQADLELVTEIYLIRKNLGLSHFAQQVASDIATSLYAGEKVNSANLKDALLAIK